MRPRQWCLLISGLGFLTLTTCSDDTGTAGGGGGAVTVDDAGTLPEAAPQDSSGGGAAVDSGSDAAGAAQNGFQPTQGTQAAVDRTAPCQPGVDPQYRLAPEDSSVYQACLPNYNVWAPIACGEPVSKCPSYGCKPDACEQGEARKPVSNGQWCVCLNLCTAQQADSTCAGGARPCIPIDDANGDQVFVCGAP